MALLIRRAKLREILNGVFSESSVKYEKYYDIKMINNDVCRSEISFRRKRMLHFF